MSVSPPVGGMPSPNTGLLASVEISNDPVAKAVMDNVLGRLPTKKPRVIVKCELCNLEFSSQTVLDSHVAGSKHQRKVKSMDLMKTLEETEVGFERDEVSGVIRCTVCDVTVNSPQLLATHIAGNKHKQRASKRAGGPQGGSPPKKAFMGPGGTGAASTNGGAEDTTPDLASPNGNPPAPQRKPGDPMDIPECVTKLEETKGGGKYLCNPCQAHCNSEQQLAQHLQSKKHQDKLSGRKPKSKDTWRGRRGRPFRGRGGRPRSHTYTQPLSSNFVASGAMI